MNTQSLVRARIDSHLKHDVEVILAKLGLTKTDAIVTLFHQIKLNNGLPFEVKIPNKQTLEAIEELESGGGYRCSDLRDEFSNF